MADEEAEKTLTPEQRQQQLDDEEDAKDDATRAAEEAAAKEAAKKRCYKFSDPPRVYTDVKVCQESLANPIGQNNAVQCIETFLFSNQCQPANLKQHSKIHCV